MAQKTFINLKAIQSVEKTENFINANSSVDASIIYLASSQDTAGMERILLAKSKGDTLRLENYVYKVLSDTTISQFR